MNMKFVSISFLLGTVLFMSGCTTNDTDYVTFSNMPYQDIPDVDSNLISLDLYTPSFQVIKINIFNESNTMNDIVDQKLDLLRSQFLEGSDMPVMIWVHGGGWRIGDKANQLQYKIPYFTNEGWIFVSVNYRLSPNDVPDDPSDLDPDRIKYPVHSQDVAAAISWVYENIDQYGGNSNQISLMGHSAGANIVSTIGTNETFLEDYGLNLSVLRHVISLDTAAYDVRERCETGAMLYLNAFGTDPTVWDAASPLNNIDPGEELPSFFLVVQGTQTRIDQTMKFVEKVNQTGTRTQLIIASEYNHSEVNQAIGHPDDEIITPELSRFLGFEND